MVAGGGSGGCKSRGGEPHGSLVANAAGVETRAQSLPDRQEQVMPGRRFGRFGRQGRLAAPRGRSRRNGELQDLRQPRGGARQGMPKGHRHLLRERRRRAPRSGVQSNLDPSKTFYRRDAKRQRTAQRRTSWDDAGTSFLMRLENGRRERRTPTRLSVLCVSAVRFFSD